MEINLLYTVLDYQRDIRYASICSEISKRRKFDWYSVTTEPDPFFSNIRRRLPDITISTIVDRDSFFTVKLEPTTVNRRNRDMNLDDYVRV